MKIIFAIFAIAVAGAWFALRERETEQDMAPKNQIADSAHDRAEGAQIGEGRVSQTNSENSAAPVESRIVVERAVLTSAGAADLMGRAIARLDRYQTVTALLRLRIRLFEADLIGSGLYQQAGQGSNRQFRFELKTQLGERVVSQLQVCDGKSLWSCRTGSGGPRVSRLDLVRVREAQTQSGKATAAAFIQELATGGLGKLLERLRTDFRSLSAEAGYLNDAPVWAVELDWNPATLAALVPQQSARASAGEPCDFSRIPQLPEGAMVFVGYEDLFPRRIEFRRRDDAQRAEGQGRGAEQSPAVTVEFTDVRFNEPLDARQFDYRPGGAVEDVTDRFLQQNGMAVAR